MFVLSLLVASITFSYVAYSGDPETDTWVRCVLPATSEKNGAHNLFPADIDGDGVMELIGQTYLDDSLVFFDYDGSGDMNDSSNWDFYIIDSQIRTGTDSDASHSNDYAHFNTPADIDLDGDIDIMVAEHTGTPDVVWYENPGNSSALTVGLWTSHSLFDWESGTEPDCFSYEARLLDADGDGDLDCAVSSKEGGDVYLVRNPSIEDWGDVESIWGNQTFLLHNTTCDYNSPDRQNWSFSCAHGQIVPGGAEEVATGVRMHGVYYWNYTGDGTSNWAENQWTRVTISEVDSGGYDGYFTDCFDIDGDGYADVITCAKNPDNEPIIIFQNPGDGSSIWNDNVLYDMDEDLRQFDCGDIDGDSDNDIVVASDEGDVTFWLENPGSTWSDNWDSHIISDSVTYDDYSHFVHFVDIDSDGDLDVSHTTCRDGNSWFNIYFNPLDPPEVPEEDILFQSINGKVNNSVLQDQNRAFNWTRNEIAIKYQLQISNSSTFSTTFVNLSDINEINYGVNYTEAGDYIEFILPSQYDVTFYGSHYYRVRAYTLD